MKFKQVIKVSSKGNEECEHVFAYKDCGYLSLKPLQHTINRICFHCGRHETVTTSTDNSNPFTYEELLNKFEDGE